MTTNQYDAIIIGGGHRAGLKPTAQYMEALRAGVHKSALADFQELRQGFIPPSIIVNMYLQKWLSFRSMSRSGRKNNVIARSALALCDEAIPN